MCKFAIKLFLYIADMMLEFLVRLSGGQEDEGVGVWVFE
jgi:hypothetical protein